MPSPSPKAAQTKPARAGSVQRRVSWRRYWSCHMHTDEDGLRFWLPRCMGGAVYGKKGCTCDPDENEYKARNEWR